MAASSASRLLFPLMGLAPAIAAQYDRLPFAPFDQGRGACRSSDRLFEDGLDGRRTEQHVKRFGVRLALEAVPDKQLALFDLDVEIERADAAFQKFQDAFRDDPAAALRRRVRS